MKRTLILIILVFILLQIQAQESRDTLFLKNGSVVYGKLIEVKDNQYKMKSIDGFLFTFSTEEVEKFILGSRSETKVVKIYDPNGLAFGIENGFLVGSGNENFFLLLSLNPMITYTLKTNHTFGLVSGIETYDQLYLPVMMEYRYNVLKKNVTPFVYARGGGLLALSGNDSYDSYKGGWTFGVGTGFRWPIAGFESYVRFGYRYAYTVHTRDNNYDLMPSSVEYTFYSNYYRLEIKWGFKF